ncbi:MULTISPECIES: flagellar basal body P-ring protein FlgI [unclassified Undibacterium]|uniref:flagellar basal body P-ring protein FlgI n=1 Tax=unclassified Undibacterium TaxID=2630295 RepID=UPI002AC95CEB|nr:MULTISPECIES: flagellar basal body P-ring protein FlgI [unclassified Undibacterium]MEB0138781.1 flagellar basal body P-ring protein FlgI [Undibacterium sp. CCC2.1]MEB0170743.1 flagellar basal body P-ring protein FlgI [Undibacterium sp. CCC1.1]MEB0174632.1 flagellar basal body P-ring protein FlgI [Undibacterium sp. CCC3.4]MEB0213829.1 flagellar basal body P-ring protein FlgI [Undibacterium sp. 5I2]WPX42555.1 flagellar basal body P-ring protein FlgI [Undibacterium sp. CCC3.4]
MTISSLSRYAVAVLRLCAVVALVGTASGAVHAERLKDLAGVAGVRQNQLLGYGLVVGLDGSGDQTTQTPFTVQSIVSMLQQMGVTLPVGTSLQLKNVAAVMVTTSLPSFAQPGQTLDVTVSSMGNAKSLRGGTLLMTPLKGADSQIYAMAQGSVLVSGVGASANGSKAQVNHLDVGRIAAGATVERAVPNALAQGSTIQLELNTSDFSTASRVVDAINRRFGADTAAALDGRAIQVKAPLSADLRVAFLGALESIDVTPAQTVAKVILNGRTGSIVMNQAVTLDACAVAHGNLSVVINTDNSASQPNALAAGQTAAVANSTITIAKDAGQLQLLKAGTSLSDVVKALNSIGATPQDLLAILQAMKASGALRAELEII